MNTHLNSRLHLTLAIMLVAVLSLKSARATELVSNGGFESGSSSWTLSGGASASSAYGYAHSGTYYLWLGGAVNENDSAYQTITIPANATAATLSFYYNINSLEGNTVAYDTFSATIRNTSGTVLATVVNLSNINQDPAGGNPYYHQQTYNLSAYAGQTIRIYFTSINDSSKVTNFRVDDVSVQVTTGSALSITTTTLPSATVGIGYAQGVAVSGGQTPYTWSVSSGNLPGGLNINSTTGAIYGTPSASGTFYFTVTVYDSSSPQQTASQALSLTVVTPSCSYSLSSYSASPSSSAGSSSFTVTTGSSCTWSAVSDSTSWLHTSSSGTGSGTVSYTYDANGSTSPRTGYIAVDGQTFTVTQAGATSLTRQGVDYSFTRPSPSGLKAAGYDFAIRYVGGSASKDITASEAQALQAAGLDIIIVYEGSATRMQSGYNAGVSDANTAVTQATAAGAPQNFFCYFACDFDAQSSDQTTINAYLDGAASILGVQRVGFYGGYYPLKGVLDAGKAAKGWQTTAWSYGLTDFRISLYQYASNVALPGDPSNEFDQDEGYGTDLGQWSVSPPTTVSIVNVSPNPSSVVAGNTFTINATVNSSQSQAVLLGASLVPAGTTSGYISDPPHDASVTLNNGNNNVSRQFTVPAGTTAGTYDLLFAVWKDSNGDGQIDSGDTHLAGTTVSGAVTVTTTATISVVANPSNGGTASGGGTYTVGSSQQISATANSGWTFTGWSDGGAQTHNITVPAGGATYTANFQQTATITVQANPSNGGTVNGGGTYTVGSSQQISATANTGWTFTGWSDGGAQTHNVTVTAGGATLTAKFDTRPIISDDHRAGTTFALSVPTQVGFNYTLEYKNAFTDANWTVVQTLGGTGGTITLTDTTATGSRRFYHVRVQ